MAYFPGTGEVLASIKAATVVHFQVNFSDASQTFNVPVPAGTFVHEVATVVTEVCDGSPTLAIGDSATAAGYLASSDIAPGTALTTTTPAVHRATAIANGYRYGKYYPTADNITFAWVAGTSPTTGVIRGWVKMSNVRLDGIPAGLTTK